MGNISHATAVPISSLRCLSCLVICLFFFVFVTPQSFEEYGHFFDKLHVAVFFGNNKSLLERVPGSS